MPTMSFEPFVILILGFLHFRRITPTQEVHPRYSNTAIAKFRFEQTLKVESFALQIKPDSEVVKSQKSYSNHVRVSFQQSLNDFSSSKVCYTTFLLCQIMKIFSFIRGLSATAVNGQSESWLTKLMSRQITKNEASKESHSRMLSGA